ncbi:hypothetical protein LIER_43131 [Lithospermum erythrorhizon]|uniref:Uncharacterized protein n=1 Tax=Lithospermum erythrorhizon TaxID=34254 RepID=A0AAV3PJ97_LITER
MPEDGIVNVVRLFPIVVLIVFHSLSDYLLHAFASKEFHDALVR